MAITLDQAARGRVTADGADLAFGHWPGRGPAVVALHGLTASHVNFAGIADRLAGRRPLLAFDLRGRGRSDKHGPFGMAQHAKDVAAAMASFGLGESVVVGHSMGAYVAVALAAMYPQRVSGLVLIDGGVPVPAPPVPVEQLLAPQLARLDQIYPDVESYLDFWRALPVLPKESWEGPGRAWIEAYLRYDLGGEPPALRPRASAEAVAADLADSLDPQVLSERLAGLTVPVLLLRAEHGFLPGHPGLIADPSPAAGLVANFTDRLLPGTTHYTIAMDDPGATTVAEAVLAFADACDRLKERA
ncbi:alpha/beta fold hydrolase [Phytomonospora endophytica]|uniref:Pimeloyl-ACP methyl ester carboxylesterase n=1 Tax=Phytomonospora endophytica TaxID=714109 RepID=A0A841FYG5_9ACTN|nr:alpha/beta hydrolase [Phytomonospora endophytica]MBB6038768.1 pimeloyl-ACP methyl ester carboxylesterase [Phytomonospora endophytica]